ncbi:MAG: hypothetical protein V3V15_01325 [Sphingorhabdus sp.]
MSIIEKADLRFPIGVADAKEIARMAGRGDLEFIDRDAIEDQLSGGPLILDGMRRRPRYFDGRFLTGADLTRDQDYVRQRQADLARAGGTGVINGLRVSNRALARGQTLRISSGVGLTPSGSVVMLRTRRDVPLLDVPTSRQLDAAMGLAEIPRVPLDRKTGLFVLALRPVEFTANPIAAYPRSISGNRRVEDGDIIEATAITLIPYPDDAGSASLNEARRNVARKIFMSGGDGLPQDALPLAMLAIDRGTVRWVDTAMVRRETGDENGLHVQLGRRPRALAEAHVVQHRAHMSDVLADLARARQTPSFPASQHFSMLPPAGQMPAAALQPDDFGFSQFYFPPGIDARLAFIPGDEIAALVDEALPLPPIDLAGDAEILGATSISILIPVTRERYMRFRGALSADGLPVNSNAGASGSQAPLDLLAALESKKRKAREASRRDTDGAAAIEAEDLTRKAWQAAFHEAVAALPQDEELPPMLWYVRQRAVPATGNVAGSAVAVSGDDVIVNELVNANIDRLKLANRVAAITAKSTPQATARLMTLLGSPAVARTDILTAAVVADLEKIAKEDVPEIDVQPAIARPPRRPGRRTVQPDARLRAFNPRMMRTINPAILGRIKPASRRFAAVRAGLNRTAIAKARGISTAARSDTKLKLGEGEVMDIAQDYSDPRLGEGFERLDHALGDKWPNEKSAIWLGETGKALDIDSAFRNVAGEKLPDFAELLKAAVAGKDSNAIDSTLKKMI